MDSERCTSDIIVKMIFGSRLYGTSTETSDIDYKAIFMPTREQVFLNRIPRTISYHTKTEENCKNSANDIDYEIYSLHYFIHLACEGETVALDMLHAPDQLILKESEIWRQIVANRQKFYTKNLKAFVGYARRQASKYGIKGSRLNAAKMVLDVCSSIAPEMRVKDAWDSLPMGEHIFKHDADANGIRMYEVCGRKTCETATVAYLMSTVGLFYKNYGERAKQAADNLGIDWKAVSHALRAAFQVKQILTQGTITFPLMEAEYLRAVKQGRLHYQDEVAPKLDTLMDEIEILSANSSLPMSADRKFWDEFLIDIVESEVV